MATLKIQDPFIATILETRFHNDKKKFLEAVKKLFQANNELEMQEYNLLKAYECGDLSIGQITKILNKNKFEVMELLEKYDIPFINVDKEYLKQEFHAFS